MITVVSLNPCVDKTLALDRFDLHAANRVTFVREDVGGKGMNVGRMLQNLDAQVQLIGFDFIGSPGMLIPALESCGLAHTLIPCPGKLRTNLKILDKSQNSTIEINEESAPVPSEKLQDMTNCILAAAACSDFLILTGSLPKGVPADYYRMLCEKAHVLHCPVAVDCDGAALVEAMKAAPQVIKPNEQELTRLLGNDPQGEDALIGALRRLIRDTGVQIICHSRGKEGAYLVTADQAFFCPAIDVPVWGVYGAGDSMLAALCAALVQKLPLPDALRHGVAASSATIQLPGTTMGSREEFDQLLPQCTIITL